MTRPVKTLIIAASILAVAAVYVAVHRSSASGPALALLDQNYKIPPPKVSLFYRTVPHTPPWSWLWRLKEAITGRRQVIHLGADVIDLSNWNESWVTNLSLPKPAFTGSNGFRMWILRDIKPAALQNQLKQSDHAEAISMAGITTADGGSARMASGNPAWINQVRTDVGFSLEVLPRIGRDFTDLTLLVQWSELVTNQPGASPSQTGSISVRTNLAVAARIQIPNNSGIFLLDQRPPDPADKRLGIILSTEILGAKK